MYICKVCKKASESTSKWSIVLLGVKTVNQQLKERQNITHNTDTQMSQDKTKTMRIFIQNINILMKILKLMLISWAFWFLNIYLVYNNKILSDTSLVWQLMLANSLTKIGVFSILCHSPCILMVFLLPSHCYSIEPQFCSFSEYSIMCLGKKIIFVSNENI